MCVHAQHIYAHAFVCGPVLFWESLFLFYYFFKIRTRTRLCVALCVRANTGNDVSSLVVVLVFIVIRWLQGSGFRVQGLGFMV